MKRKEATQERPNENGGMRGRPRPKEKPELNLTREEVAQILSVMSFGIDENFYGLGDTDLYSQENKKHFMSACDKLKKYAEEIEDGLC